MINRTPKPTKALKFFLWGFDVMDGAVKAARHFIDSTRVAWALAIQLRGHSKALEEAMKERERKLREGYYAGDGGLR